MSPVMVIGKTADVPDVISGIVKVTGCGAAGGATGATGILKGRAITPKVFETEAELL